MSTRSSIGIKREDGSIQMSYCHSDGYFSHNGRLLLAHHNSLKCAKALVAEGSLSSLGEVIGEKHDFAWRDDFDMDWDAIKADPRSKMCRFYGRDRCETDVGAQKFANIADAENVLEEYLYLWDVARGCWIAASIDCSPPTFLKWFTLEQLGAEGYLAEGNHDDPAEHGAMKPIPYDEAFMSIANSAAANHAGAQMDTVMEALHSF